MSTVLVTGAGGFVGSAATRALAGDSVRLRLLRHRRDVAEVPGAETVVGDLTDPGSLHAACEGVDTVVHLAAEVGSDPQRCARVNVDGTANLLAAAAHAGVRHVVHLSTAALHGRGPHRDLPEDSPPRPASVASRSRWRAEQLTGAAGAVVLRPFFVYGPGDRWYLPTVLRRLQRGHWFDRGRAPHSVVSVDDLAAVVSAAVRRPRDLGGGPFHVCEPDPVSPRQIADALGLRHRRVSVPWWAARVALRPLPRRSRRAELLAVEHTYASDRIWRAAGVVPGRPMLDRLPELVSA